MIGSTSTPVPIAPHHEAQWPVEELCGGAHVGQVAVVWPNREPHAVMTVVGVGIGVFRSTGQADSD